MDVGFLNCLLAKGKPLKLKTSLHKSMLIRHMLNIKQHLVNECEQNLWKEH